MTKITRKYQITLPRRVREDLRLKMGDEVVFVKQGSEYKLSKADRVIEEGVELCKDIQKTIGEMRKGVGKGVK